MNTTRPLRTTTRLLGLALGASLAVSLVALPATSALAEPSPNKPTPPAQSPAAQLLRAASAGPLIGPQLSEQNQLNSLARGPRKDLQRAVDGVVADGAVSMTVRTERGRHAQSAAAGVREPGQRPPANPTSPFRVASNTKMMVATVAMQLVEQGTWSLSTTVDEVWPGLLPGHGDVTIEQLIRHRSGIPDGVVAAITDNLKGDTFQDFADAIGADYSDEGVLAAALRQPWLFESGSQGAYSNTGYIVLGQLLEHATGQDLARLLKAKVFRPAGMTGTAYLTRTGLPRKALVDTARADGETAVLDDFDPELFSAAGAVVSTTRDLDAFTRSLATGRLVSPKTFALMQQTQPVTVAVGADGEPVTVDYGLGIYPLPDPCVPGGRLWGHDGATFGTLSLAMTSADGTRQVSAGWTGRYYNSDGTTPYDANDALGTALLASCG